MLRVHCFPGAGEGNHYTCHGHRLRAAHEYNVYIKNLEQKVQVTIQIEQNLVKHFSFKQKFLLFLFINNNNNNNNKIKGFTENAEKLQPSCIVGGNVKWGNYYEKSFSSFSESQA